MNNNQQDAVREALKLAANTFRTYEHLHRAKPDHEKADRNRDMAIMMEEAFATIAPATQNPVSNENGGELGFQRGVDVTLAVLCGENYMIMSDKFGCRCSKELLLCEYCSARRYVPRNPQDATRESLSMVAYNYSFEPTGNLVIDRILSAVARAGKASHDTEYWGDRSNGESYIDEIQNFANEAAIITTKIQDTLSNKNGDAARCQIAALKQCVREREELIQSLHQHYNPGAGEFDIGAELASLATNPVIGKK